MGDAANTREHVAVTASEVEKNSAASGRLTVLFFGTSLTAGYGLSADQAFPAVIGREAERSGMAINVVNAGLSGETTAGAVRRIDWVLKTPADVVVIETGANDALRGLSAESARSNIEHIVARVKLSQPNAKIVLVEMLAPPNLGPVYASAFRSIYSSIAKREKVALVPFFLDGVAGNPELNQGDGVHPNSAGAKVIADNVWRVLGPVVTDLIRDRE